jgi:regulator of protease activity HflC (stomatin/prohibitin superfamily)
MTHEKEIRAVSGWLMLFVEIALLLASGFGLYRSIEYAAAQQPFGWLMFFSLLGLSVAGIFMAGFFVVEPNGSKVLLLFGKYKGTVKDAGFHWTNPFMTKRSLSLRVRTLNGDRLKVNDLAGNPVEIAAIVVWQVEDTYEASFEVDDYEQYVTLQSETAVRSNAGSYPYDAEDDTLSLRRNTEEVSEHLKVELNERLQRAGVKVLEARLSHLAYAPEIAGAMRRQQAAAIIAARQRIVDGAVGMVEMALQRMQAEGVVKLDEERQAAMVSNLMVVLCSEHAAQPVVNASTLYP